MKQNVLLMDRSALLEVASDGRTRHIRQRHPPTAHSRLGKHAHHGEEAAPVIVEEREDKLRP